jgi:hypothetical protein
MRKSTWIIAVFALALILLWVYGGRVAMENRGFVVTGYGVTWGALLWYAFRLEGRGRATARAIGSFEAIGGEDHESRRVSEGHSVT